MVNMGGLEKAIDQVGGVTVKSPLTFDYEGYHFTKDVTYHMNGKKEEIMGVKRDKDL